MASSCARATSQHLGAWSRLLWFDSAQVRCSFCEADYDEVSGAIEGSTAARASARYAGKLVA